jgi:hypothetical protein
VIVAFGKAAGIGGGEALDMLRRTKDVVPEGVPTKEYLLKVVEDEFYRIIFVAVYLLEDDSTFLIYLVLRISAVENDIGEQFQSTCEVLLQEGRVYDGLLLVGVGIEFTPHILHTV